MYMQWAESFSVGGRCIQNTTAAESKAFHSLQLTAHNPCLCFCVLLRCSALLRGIAPLAHNAWKAESKNVCTLIRVQRLFCPFFVQLKCLMMHVALQNRSNLQIMWTLGIIKFVINPSATICKENSTDSSLMFAAGESSKNRGMITNTTLGIS